MLDYQASSIANFIAEVQSLYNTLKPFAERFTSGLKQAYCPLAYVVGNAENSGQTCTSIRGRAFPKK